MRICSLVPSATEMLFALGLGDQVVAVSHECDFPPAAARKPRATMGLIDPRILSSVEIDRQVSDALRRGVPLYAVDLDLLRSLQPELIVTQDLCNVCAVEGNRVRQVADALDPIPQVVALEPASIRDVINGIWTLAEAANVPGRAVSVAADIERRLAILKAGTEWLDRPKVLCLEWLDPAWIAGHWMPEVVELAGGQQVLARSGAPSTRETWDDIASTAPEVAIIMPCGFDVERTLAEIHGLDSIPQFRRFPAFRHRRVYVVDGSAYFNRAGPRLVDGAELLATLLHPEAFDTGVEPEAAVKLAPSGPGRRLRFRPIV